MSDNALLKLVTAHPDLFGGPSLPKIFLLIVSAIKLKDDILLAQPAEHSSTEPPDYLPPSVVVLLSRICSLTESIVEGYWRILKGIVWNEGLANTAMCPEALEAQFAKHGQDRGFRA
jgi:hypothetical protein